MRILLTFAISTTKFSRVLVKDCEHLFLLVASRNTNRNSAQDADSVKCFAHLQFLLSGTDEVSGESKAAHQSCYS
jgi:hypothetical protein